MASPQGTFLYLHFHARFMQEKSGKDLLLLMFDMHIQQYRLSIVQSYTNFSPMKRCLTEVYLNQVCHLKSKHIRDFLQIITPFKLNILFLKRVCFSSF